MNKKCIYLKQKMNKTCECKKTKKLIKLSQCNNCKYKEYKEKEYKQIKQRTYKQAKAEKNRFSIFTTDLDHCIICGAKKDNLHEVLFGRNRLNSIEYGLVMPLCVEHHLEMHKNKGWQDYWHIKGQQKFIKTYPDLVFEDIFHINYLDK